jgi:hypothetical protein
MTLGQSDDDENQLDAMAFVCYPTLYRRRASGRRAIASQGKASGA